MNTPTKLIAKIDYFLEPDARETGRILDRLGIAYGQYLKTNGEAAQRLVLLNVEISSWIATIGAFFEAGAAVTKLVETREHLSGFVQGLVVSLETVRQSNAGQVPTAIRNLLVELATPINRTRASEVHIHVHGDNANVFVLDRAGADAVAAAFAKPVPVATTVRERGPAPVRSEPSGIQVDADATLGMRSTSARLPGAVEATLNYKDGAWFARMDDKPHKPLPVSNVVGPIDTALPHRAVGRVLYARSRQPQFFVDLVNGAPRELS